MPLTKVILFYPFKQNIIVFLRSEDKKRELFNRRTFIDSLKRISVISFIALFEFLNPCSISQRILYDSLDSSCVYDPFILLSISIMFPYLML